MEKNTNQDSENKNLPTCCQPKSNKKGFSGLIYGLIPHAGCIAFIIGSILGVTVLTQVFKPLLMNRNFFYYLILLSLGFATLSSFLYLRKNKALSKSGIKSHKTYLLIMYGSTIGINILFFFVLFPFLANVNNGVSAQEIQGLSTIKLQVDIPCPGHAPLISTELKTISGVKGSEYSYPNKFLVYYDSSLTSKEKILSLDVFKEYPAKVLEEGKAPGYIETNVQQNKQVPNQITNQPTKSAISNNVQTINMDIDSSGYNPNSFVLKKGITIKWIINVKELTACNQEIILKDFNVDITLKQGINTIEFTPDKTGQFGFHCGMNMLKGTILVTESGTAKQDQIQSLNNLKTSSKGGCGCQASS